MIPKRKTPQTGKQVPSNQTQKSNTKPASKTSAKTASKSSGNYGTHSQKPSDQKSPSIVELLQNQIEEERKNVRNKNQIKSRQNTSSSQSRQREILQKKRSANSNAIHAPNSQQDISHPPPDSNQEKMNENPKYVSIETSPHSSYATEQADTHKTESRKTEKVEMAAEAVGDDEAPQPKKLQPTGFTYFDKLNEKDIFLDPLKYF